MSAGTVRLRLVDWGCRTLAAADDDERGGAPPRVCGGRHHL